MLNKLKRFLKDEDGGVAEEGIIIGILVVVGAVFFFFLRGKLGEIFGDVKETLEDY